MPEGLELFASGPLSSRSQIAATEKGTPGVGATVSPRVSVTGGIAGSRA